MFGGLPAPLDDPMARGRTAPSPSGARGAEGPSGPWGPQTTKKAKKN